MKTRVSVVGWVFLLMVGVSYFGYYFISMLRIENFMLQNGLGTILLGLPAAAYLMLQEKKDRKKVRFHCLPWKAVLLLIVITIALEMVTIEINMATSLIFSDYTTQAISADVLSSGLIISLICMAVLPAVFEELSFRAAFFQEYRNAYGAWAGALLSGFLFGIYHMNMRQFVYAFICGVFFALLVEATDSIVSSMLLHFFMNAISCITIYASKDVADISTEMSEAAQTQYILAQMIAFLPAAMLGAALLVICYIALAKCCGQYDYVKELFSLENIRSGRRIGSEQTEGRESFRTPW